MKQPAFSSIEMRIDAETENACLILLQGEPCMATAERIFYTLQKRNNLVSKVWRLAREVEQTLETMRDIT
jgi:hypothetical protein